VMVAGQWVIGAGAHDRAARIASAFSDALAQLRH